MFKAIFFFNFGKNFVDGPTLTDPICGRPLPFFSSGPLVARHTHSSLKGTSLNHAVSTDGSRFFLTVGLVKNFEKLSEGFLLLFTNAG